MTRLSTIPAAGAQAAVEGSGIVGEAAPRAIGDPKSGIVGDSRSDPVLFERLYTNWAESGAAFCGIHRFNWNGIDTAMELVTTFELVLDASFVRRNFRPSDLFNRLRLVDGRVIEFDTMLYVQHHSPRRVVRSIDENHQHHRGLPT
jgi:hypothetical protein